MQLKKLKAYRSFIKEMTSMLTPENLEKNFGIVIKKHKSGDEINFNLYKDGELIFADISEYDISEIVEQLGYKVSSIIARKATKDTNTEEVAKRIVEQKQETREYYICEKCGKRYHKSKSHYHEVGAD